MSKFNPQIQIEDDGLYIPEVREWSLEKYKLVGSYCDIFSSGMKNKWDQLVYIDLFAGAGYARIQESSRVYLSSALIALSTPAKFTKYILCEQDNERFKALEQRVRRDFDHLNVELIHGDSNANVEAVLNAIPRYGRGNTLLPFCFVDPFSLNLQFSTIEALGRQKMDFLILQALHMDANRNIDNYYLNEQSVKIEEYLGVKDWRSEFEEKLRTGEANFVQFLADKYQEQMNNLGYQKQKYTHQIRSNDRNLPLYYLSFYSKDPRGVDFFKKVQKHVSSQLTFDF